MPEPVQGKRGQYKNKTTAEYAVFLGNLGP